MSPKLSKQLSPGDVITEDMPLIHVLDVEFKGKCCDKCLKRSDQLKRCSKCLRMHYCTIECQKNDWKYHKNECPLFGHHVIQDMIDDKFGALWLRLYLSVQNIPTFATEKHRLIDGSEVSLRDISVDVSAASDDIRSHCQIVCLVFTELGINFDAQEVLHWSQFLVTVSNFGIKFGDQLSITNTTVGSGLYVTYSLFGHSCQPNSALVMKKDLSLQLRAMRPIAAGEDITISYVSLQQNRANRQKALEFWSIDCECDKCVQKLDSRVDYDKYFSGDILPLRVFSFGSQIVDYLRQVLTDLDVMYGDYNPLKTYLMFTIIMALYYCPLIPEPFMNEMKANLMKAFDVTFGANSPLKARIVHSISTGQLCEQLPV
ncbi:unnamed protein product [Medioppia subpectinata]|uniref:MYND-type domain-containing protein n=1 Tax=Medioppia subpectinata TaxID=1979941 RepID=A0A7R9L385_9ACAR|nr:unnamed protein product [Medioppia subpectinata]CAG2114599.1 unnamed protein product [Medioppia subpectinata]